MSHAHWCVSIHLHSAALPSAHPYTHTHCKARESGQSRVSELVNGNVEPYSYKQTSIGTREAKNKAADMRKQKYINKTGNMMEMDQKIPKQM